MPLTDIQTRFESNRRNQELASPVGVRVEGDGQRAVQHGD